MQTKSQLAHIIVRLYGRSDANATRVKRTLRYVQILRCDLSLLHDACSANLGRMRNMWLYRALGSKSVNGSQVKRKTFFCMVRNEY